LLAVAICAWILLAIFVASSQAPLPLLSFRKFEKELEVFVLPHFAVLCCWGSREYIYICFALLLMRWSRVLSAISGSVEMQHKHQRERKYTHRKLPNTAFLCLRE
jgi:hypothetical protein